MGNIFVYPGLQAGHIQQVAHQAVQVVRSLPYHVEILSNAKGEEELPENWKAPVVTFAGGWQTYASDVSPSSSWLQGRPLQFIF